MIIEGGTLGVDAKAYDAYYHVCSLTRFDRALPNNMSRPEPRIISPLRKYSVASKR